MLLKNKSILNLYVSLIIVGVVGLTIRLYYFPYNVPITFDGIGYFWYAIDMSILGSFPTGYDFPNNGWPAFLSLFFSLLKSDNFLDFMTLQRLLTVIISVLTIIPLYLLCSRFFDKRYAVFGVAIFIFEPRIIINSLLGTTEASFLLLGTTTLYLFFGNSLRTTYASFGVAALFSLVRYEGLLIIVPLSILFFMKHKSERKIIFKFFLAASVFLLIVIPMAYIRTQTQGYDGLTSHVIAGAVAHQYISVYPDTDESYYFHVIQTTFMNLGKYLGWIMIPSFIWFVPLGVILIIKNKVYKKINYKKLTLLLFTLSMLIPAAYAYSRGYEETKYLYILFPVFCLLSAYFMKSITIKFFELNKIFVPAIIILIALSVVFLELRGPDNQYDKEAYLVALRLFDLADGINNYQQHEYAETAFLTKYEFPILKNTISQKPKILYIEENSLEDYLLAGKKEGLTHIVIDNYKQDLYPKFLVDVFYHEEKYSYLAKVFDSSELGYKYRAKIFEINYKKFDKMLYGN